LKIFIKKVKGSIANAGLALGIVAECYIWKGNFEKKDMNIYKNAINLTKKPKMY